MLAGMFYFFQAGAGCTVFLVKISMHLALRKTWSVFFPLMTTMQKNTLPKTKVAPENGLKIFQTIPLGFFPPENLPQNDSLVVCFIRFIPGPFFPPQWIHN